MVTERPKPQELEDSTPSSHPSGFRRQLVWSQLLAGSPTYLHAWPRPGQKLPTPTPARGLLVLARASPAWGLQSCAGLGLSPHAHSLARQDSGCKTDPSLASSAHLPLPAAHLPPRVWATVPQCAFCWRSRWQSFAPPLSPHAEHTSQPLGWATTTITAGPDCCPPRRLCQPRLGQLLRDFQSWACCLPTGGLSSISLPLAAAFPQHPRRISGLRHAFP